MPELTGEQPPVQENRRWKIGNPFASFRRGRQPYVPAVIPTAEQPASSPINQPAALPQNSEQPTTVQNEAAQTTVGYEFATDPVQSAKSETSLSPITPTTSSLEIGSEKFFHPYIEEGIRNVLEEQLPKIVQSGNIQFLPTIGNRLVEAVRMHQAATESSMQLTPESLDALKARINTTIGENLHAGLQSIIEHSTRDIDLGLDFGINNGHKQLDALFKIADELGVNIALPTDEEEVVDSSQIVPVTTEREAIHGYLDEKINDHLLRGTERLLKGIGYAVSRGSKDQLERDSKRLDEWLTLLPARGYTVVDKEPTMPHNGDEATGVVPREINRQEVERIKDEQIKSNVIYGISGAINTAGSNLRNAIYDPLAPVADEKMSFFQELGEKYGIIDQNLSTFIEGEKWNPNQLNTEMEKIINENLPKAFAVIIKGQANFLEKGNITVVEHFNKLVESYFNLGDQFGIQVDKDGVKQNMKANITPERIQKGVTAIIATGKKWLQRGEFSYAKLASSDADAMRKFIEDNGLSEQVDLAPLDAFLKETGLQHPQLSGTSA